MMDGVNVNSLCNIDENDGTVEVEFEEYIGENSMNDNDGIDESDRSFHGFNDSEVNRNKDTNDNLGFLISLIKANHEESIVRSEKDREEAKKDKEEAKKNREKDREEAKKDKEEAKKEREKDREETKKELTEIFTKNKEGLREIAKQIGNRVEEVKNKLDNEIKSDEVKFREIGREVNIVKDKVNSEIQEIEGKLIREVHVRVGLELDKIKKKEQGIVNSDDTLIASSDTIAPNFSNNNHNITTGNKINTHPCKTEQNTIIPEHPGDTISVDYYGPLPMAKHGFKYLLVITDNFSKFVKIYPLVKESTVPTIKAVKQYFKEFGKPKSLISDNGTQFISKIWKNFLNRYKVKHILTPIRHPQANITERINRDLGEYFRTSINNKKFHSTWFKYIYDIELVLNSTWQSTIKMSPIEAHFGLKPFRPWDQYPCIDHTEYRSLEYLERNEMIRARIKLAGDIRNRRHNLSIIKSSSFKLGDLVLLKALRISREGRQLGKFSPIFEGPYMIDTVFQRGSYLLVEPEFPHRKRGVFHISLLKPYHIQPAASQVN